MRLSGQLGYAALVGGAVGVLAAAKPASASLIDHGITYTLAESVVNATTDQFTLTIIGINDVADTEKGRSGVQSLAFNPPKHLASVAAPAGFTEHSDGLNSGGCNASGNFFCLAANVTPP